jgi:hypothetical protein
VTVTATPTGLALYSRLTSVKASCLCLFLDPEVAQPVVPVVWPRVSVQLAAAPAVPAVAIVAAYVAAVAVAEPREAVPVLHASPVLSAATQYAVTLALLYAVPTRCAVAA